MLKQNTQRKITRSILRWYKRQGRILPWRLPADKAGGISNPYRILISEIMLQQTQVSRVLVKYHEFLNAFPTLRSLAAAEQKEVILAWRGMGYNNRAVRLHKFARAVIKKHSGKIPSAFDDLIALPGIGRYTANALLSSAFGKQVPIVDVNVQRVLSRLCWRMKSSSMMRSERDIWKLAELILPPGKAYDWNQALMDFGATICTARKPKCTECPVSRPCASKNSMNGGAAVQRKIERSLDGIPDRYYRGRTVEHLRTHASTRLDVLGKTIHKKFSSRNEIWLRRLLARMVKDELIRIRGNGSLRTSWVSLA